MASRIGILFDRDIAPEELPGFARAVEEAGADDLWVVEDLSWPGSIATATIALAATTRIRVGIGIAPVPLRNPALLAMELATLARVYPGRLVAGLGHGVPEWMRQVGAEHKGKLALLSETIEAVRGLLHGDKVELTGREVTVDGITLVHPPAEAPPLVAGVVGPRSLELSGKHADGTILPEGFGPARIKDALDAIARGRATGDRPAHELIVFTYLRIAETEARAAEEISDAIEGQAAWLGVPPADVFSVLGPESIIEPRVTDLEATGATTIVLRPMGPDPLPQALTALKALAISGPGGS
ncbi:LLM class flavin-dependent oxidoreductase [Winogradskya consettensis]|uniref:LLM class flavin-dependent oxidoreductase n=1 Tax=Winogradskya consettensis TaxID=113560 RepID=UPI001BB3D932|nr:LLM class flavin-dependent oxidoreductase [Actinoplanes consettensis]